MLPIWQLGILRQGRSTLPRSKGVPAGFLATADEVIERRKGCRSALGLGRVKTFSCRRSELDEVATRAIFPDFDYALIAAISG